MSISSQIFFEKKSSNSVKCFRELVQTNPNRRTNRTDEKTNQHHNLREELTNRCVNRSITAY